MDAEIRAITPPLLLGAAILILIGWVRHDAFQGYVGVWPNPPKLVSHFFRRDRGPVRLLPVSISTWGWVTMLLTVAANMDSPYRGALLVAATTVCLDGWLPVGVIWVVLAIRSRR